VWYSTAKYQKPKNMKQLSCVSAVLSQMSIESKRRISRSVSIQIYYAYYETDDILKT